MKKLIAAATALALAGAGFSSLAEGYQVNTLSARQMGMGHTGVAQKLGAESMIFNPAGMAFMTGTIDFSGSFTGTFAHAKATLPNGTTYTTDNTPSTPMAVNLGMSVYKSLKAGVSFYTPYGSGINWGENWPYAVLNQSVTLKAFTLQPTLSWAILPNLSIGAGAMVTWGTVDLDKGLVSGAAFNAVNPLWPADNTAASLNLNGKAAVTVGVNAGVLWSINSKVSVGASFRSKMNLTVKSGTASITYANETAQNIIESKAPLGLLNHANFTATMPAAAVWNLGVAYRPTSRLLLAFDAQLTQWSAYKSLNVEFLADLPPVLKYQNIPKNYRNAMTYKLGAQYSLTPRLELRAGLMIDTTPVRSDNYNPETPGMTKINPSIGFSFSPLPRFSIDASLLYVAGLGVDNASITTADLLTQSPVSFSANYKVHAWSPSIGLSYRF